MRGIARLTWSISDILSALLGSLSRFNRVVAPEERLPPPQENSSAVGALIAHV
jgi:hypothetical protein